MEYKDLFIFQTWHLSDTADLQMLKFCNGQQPTSEWTVGIIWLYTLSYLTSTMWLLVFLPPASSKSV